MASQSLAIVATLDDGMEEPGPSWNANGYSNTIWCDAGTHIGLGFVLTSAVPSGATISKAYMRLRHNDGPSADGCLARIKVEDADPASAARWASGHLPSGATYIGQSAQIDMDDLAAGWFFGESDSYATDLTTQVQALVNKYSGLANGGRINVALLNDGGTGYMAFDDYSGGAGNAAQLYIEWTEGGGGGRTALVTRAKPLGVAHGVSFGVQY